MSCCDELSAEDVCFVCRGSAGEEEEKKASVWEKEEGGKGQSHLYAPPKSVVKAIEVAKKPRTGPTVWCSEQIAHETRGRMEAIRSQAHLPPELRSKAATNREGQQDRSAMQRWASSCRREINDDVITSSEHK